MPDISLSLKGTSPEMKELIFRNLSKRAAERLKEEREFMGPKPRKEVEEAQQRVVAVVRRLEEEGKVTLGRGGATAGDEMLA
jgi:flagellar motor switch protein FliG